jgi:presenilin-like A22 family membrane protease
MDKVATLPKFKKLRPDLFLRIGSLFIFAQLLALFVSQRLKGIPEVQASIESNAIGTSSFIIYILVAVGIFFALIRFSRTRKALKIFWLVAIASGLQLFLRAIFHPHYALLLTLAIIILYWKAPTIYLHNGILIAALPAIAALFGNQLAPWTVVELLILFSIYDVTAVYGTKHMIVMAQSFLEEKVVPGLILAETRIDPVQYVSEISIGSGFSVLGTGDVVFPAILVASASHVSLLSGILVAGFSLIGLFLTHVLFFGQRERKPMPALPPIAIMSILGFVVSQFLNL